MSKNVNPPPYNPSAAPPGYGIPPAAPPSYAEASGAAPYQPSKKILHMKKNVFETGVTTLVSDFEGAKPIVVDRHQLSSIFNNSTCWKKDVRTAIAGFRYFEVWHYSATKQPTVIVTTVVPVGPDSTHMICPHCRFEIESSTTRKPGLIAYLSGFVIFMLGCWCGCCLLPCCVDSCMDVHHSCPNCNAYLGRYSR